VTLSKEQAKVVDKIKQQCYNIINKSIEGEIEYE